MSKRRRACATILFPTRRDDGGGLLCAVCGKPLTGGRRRYCDEQCMDVAWIATNPSHARMKVWGRDKGVCASCGCDTEKLKRILKAAKHHLDWRELVDVRRELGFTTEHLWEMDHVLPVIEGGGLCGLDDLQTLCIPCHRAETRELAARRAAAKRGMPLFKEIV